MTSRRPKYTRLLKADRIRWFRAACHGIEAYPHIRRSDNTATASWREWLVVYTVVTRAGPADIEVRCEFGWPPDVTFRFDDPPLAQQVVSEIRQNSAERIRIESMNGFWRRRAGGTTESASWALCEFLDDLRELMPVPPNSRAKAAAMLMDYDTALASIQECLVERAAKAAFRASVTAAKESHA